MALRIVICLTGILFMLPGGAAASSESGKRPWRLTSAPADASTLLAMATEQPEPGEVSDVPRDSTRTRIDNGTQPTNQQPSQNKTPTFALPDTTSRANSTKSFPGGDSTAVETLGPSSAIQGFPTANIPRPTAAAPRARRGVLGIHPLAILAGLVALHIFIVTVAGK
jgi:hypothetical protein